MGCVSSVFQYGTYLVDEKAASEVKDESENAEKTDTQSAVPAEQQSSDSSGKEALQESGGKPKSDPPVAKDDAIEASEPAVQEIERLRETKLEKEKTVTDTGETKEKTVFTEYHESVRVEESKGPVSNPFSSPQKKSLFPSFTEVKYGPQPTDANKDKDSTFSRSEAGSNRTSGVSSAGSEVFHVPVRREDRVPGEPAVPPRGLFTGSLQSEDNSGAAKMGSPFSSYQRQSAPVSSDQLIQNIESARSSLMASASLLDGTSKSENSFQSPGALQSKVQSGLTDASAQVKSKTQEVEKRIEQAQTKTEESIKSQLREAEKSVQETQAKVEENLTEVKSQLQTKVTETEKSVQETQAKVEEQVTEVKSHIQSQIQQTGAGLFRAKEDTERSVSEAKIEFKKKGQEVATDVQDKTQAAVSKGTTVLQSKAEEVEKTLKSVETGARDAVTETQTQIQCIARNIETEASQAKDKVSAEVQQICAKTEESASAIKADFQTKVEKFVPSVDEVQETVSSEFQSKASEAKTKVEAKSQEAKLLVESKTGEAKAAVEAVQSKAIETTTVTEATVRSNVQNVQSSAQDAVSSAKVELEGATQKAEGKLLEARETAENIAVSAKAQLESKVRETEANVEVIGTQVQTKAEEVSVVAQQAAGKVKETLSEAKVQAEQVPAKAREVVSQAQATVQETAVQGKAKVDEVLSEVNFQNIQTKIQETVAQTNVLQSIEDAPEHVFIEAEPSDENEAAVKIQAGIRGYLTRKSLKEKKEQSAGAKTDGDSKAAALLADLASLGPADLPKLEDISFEPLEPEIEALPDELLDNNALVWREPGDEENILNENSSQLIDFLEEEEETEDTGGQLDGQDMSSWLEEGEEGESKGQEQAATKIQAAFRGYKVRRDKKSK